MEGQNTDSDGPGKKYRDFDHYLAAHGELERTDRAVIRKLMGRMVLEELQGQGKTIEDLAFELPGEIPPAVLRYLLNNASWMDEGRLTDLAHHLGVHFSFTVSAVSLK